MLPTEYTPHYTVTFSENPFSHEIITAPVPLSVPVQALFGERDSYDGFKFELDGAPLELSLTEPLYLSDSQILLIRQVPQDSDIFRTVLMIVSVIVITVFAPEAWLPGSWQYAAYVATASVAASLAINSLIPFDLPEPIDRSGKHLDDISPLRNALNPYEPISQIFGRLKQYPAYAAFPYTEIIGNDQYLNALLLVGYGDICEPEKIAIGTTYVEDFVGFEVKYVNAEDVDYPVLFEESLNLDFIQPNTPGSQYVRSTAPDAKYIGLDFTFPRGLAALYKDGGREKVYVDFRIEVKLSGDTAWTQIKSGENNINQWEDLSYGDNSVTINTTTYGIQRGAKRVVYKTVTPDAVVRAWTTIDSGTGVPNYTDDFRVSGKTLDTIRRGIKFAPPYGAGIYDVRLTRLATYSATSPTTPRSEVERGTQDWSNYYSTDAIWTALRTYKDSTGIVPVGEAPGDTKITYAQIRIKATDQLSGALDQYNHIIQRVYTYWNGSAWVKDSVIKGDQVYPRNPAWAAIEVLTADMNPRPVDYSQIDAYSFKAWADWCKSNNFYYDEEIYGSQSVWDVLRGIAATGRAEIVVKDGKYTVIQDNGASLPVQMFTPRNSSGFKGSKSFIEKIHGVKVNYRSAVENYEQTEQVVYADGYTKLNASKFETITLNGVTDDSQAWREGRRFMAIAIHRPEFFEINADIEHIISTRGDTVLLQHEAALVGQITLRVVAAVNNAPYALITLDGEVLMEDGTDYSIQVRSNLGAAVTIATYQVLSQPQPNQIYLTGQFATGTIKAGNIISFGERNLVTLRCKVLAIAPKKDLAAAITLIPEGAPIYSADTGTIPPYDPVITRPPDFSRIIPAPPIILTVTSGNWSSPPQADGSIINRMMVAYLVQHLQNYEGIEVQGRIRESNAGEELPHIVIADWRTTDWSSYDGGAIWFDHVQVGVAYDVQVRIRTIPNFLTSAWTVTTLHTVGEVNHKPPTISGMTTLSQMNGIRLTIDTSSIQLRDAQYVEVIYTPTGDRSNPTELHKFTYNVPANITAVNTISFPIPLPDGQLYYFWARIVNRFGNESAWYPEDIIGTDDIRITDIGDTRITDIGDIRILNTAGEPSQAAGVTGFALQDLIWYILPARGTAIKNGGGTLRLEAHKYSTAGDDVLTSGTIQMYLPDGTTLAGDGYVWDPIGAADITGSLVITLKDSVGGKVYDTVTLADITDGTTIPDLPLGWLEADRLLWRRDKDDGSWLPDSADIDVLINFQQGTTMVARDALALSLNTSTGAITVSAATHPSGDLDATNITILINGATRTLPYVDGTVVTIDASYTINGQVIHAIESFYSVEGGSAGTTGPPGTSGSLTITIKSNYANFTTAHSNSLYIHGFDAGGAGADVDGTIVHDGAQITLTKGTVHANQESLADGWVLFDSGLTGVFTGNGSASYGGVTNYNLALVKNFRDGWKYDDLSSGVWTPFTLTPAMILFGSYTKSGADVTTGSITSVVTMGNGISPGSVPVEASNKVRPGDIDPAAIDSIAAFAATLTPIEIVDAIPSGGTWTGSPTIFNTADRKLYRLVSNTPAVWTQKIVGHEDIEAESIKAGQMEIGAIGVDQLAANAVTASKIAIQSQGQALNPNPLLNDLKAWTASYNFPADYLGNAPAIYSVVAADNVGVEALRIQTATVTNAWFFSKIMPCDVSKTYRVSCWARKTAGDCPTYLNVSFFDSTGAHIDGGSSGATGWPSLGQFHYWGAVNVQLPSGWTKYTFTFGPKGIGSFPVALTARSFQIGALAVYATGTTATTVEFQDFRVEEVLPGTLIEDGGITTDKLGVNSVTAVKINSDEIETRHLKTSAVTADKLNVGSVTAQKMQITGANMVNDPSFEFSTPPSTTAWNLVGPGIAQVVSGYGSAGDKSLQLMKTVAGGSYAYSNLIPVTPGEFYLVSGDYQLYGAAGSYFYPVHVWMYDSLKAYVTSTQAPQLPSPVAVWTTTSLVLEIPAGVYYIAVGSALNATAPNGAQVITDNFRVVRAADASLIVDGAIKASKLETNLVIASSIHTANPHLENPSIGEKRVTIDNTSVPLWIGSGAKTKANAKLQYDAATQELLVRGTIEASQLAASTGTVLPVKTSAGALCPLVSIFSAPVFSRDERLLTTTGYVDPDPSGGGIMIVQIVAHDSGTSFDSRRLQSALQPFRIKYRGHFHNSSNSVSVICSIRPEYSYNGTTWLTVTDSVDGTFASGFVGPGRSLSLSNSIWVQPAASPGWTSVRFRLRISAGTANLVYFSGAELEAYIPNLGQLSTWSAGRLWE